MSIELEKDRFSAENGTEDEKPGIPQGKRRRRIRLILIMIAVLLALIFGVIQCGMRYTANSSYKAGCAWCKNLWLMAEQIAEEEGITLPDRITPDSPLGQKISVGVNAYDGNVRDFRVCCLNGKIYMVVCNKYGRKLEESDIRFHTRDEQIDSLSSYFTRRKTVACVTDADMKTVFDD